MSGDGTGLPSLLPLSGKYKCSQKPPSTPASQPELAHSETPAEREKGEVLASPTLGMEEQLSNDT